MRIRILVVAALMAWVAVQAVPNDDPTAPPATPPPKPTALAETLEKRLVQLDVGVEGDPDAIRAITAKDFALYVGEHEISGLIVDHLCGEAPAPEPETKSEQPNASPSSAAPKVTRPRGTFIFFFDQTHLTQAGRALSLETARELINRLVVDGSRASIVSSSRRLETIVPMTGDPEKLEVGFVVERWLEDGLAREFAPMSIAESDSPCLQTVDAVPPGRLRPGVVDYRVVARIGDEIVAQERRTLRVGAAGDPR